MTNFQFDWMRKAVFFSLCILCCGCDFLKDDTKPLQTVGPLETNKVITFPLIADVIISQGVFTNTLNETRILNTKVGIRNLSNSALNSMEFLLEVSDSNNMAPFSVHQKKADLSLAFQQLSESEIVNTSFKGTIATQEVKLTLLNSDNHSSNPINGLYTGDGVFYQDSVLQIVGTDSSYVTDTLMVGSVSCQIDYKGTVSLDFDIFQSDSTLEMRGNLLENGRFFGSVGESSLEGTFSKTAANLQLIQVADTTYKGFNFSLNRK
jgi:hypothetical protein